ncbi:cell division protein FtsB [Deinococcus irradiatisoli]|uniref:Cell division protein FtsB n=1 Tax=Deinococcus irradiatisoli TaxID=2202254 RepID=A0A2Z3JFW5_9DEIO|nr:cell division protein FtsB [Deinococcus irradiatisoli]AWN22371.1 cell division protein FtsB [Deinococcus irradiatisoli]
MKFRLPHWEEVRRLPLTMMIASLLAALGIVQMSFLLGQGVYRYVTWTQQTGVALAQEAQLKQDVEILQVAKAKASDPEYMNALARCIGYVGKNERVVVAQSAQDNPGANGGNCDPVRLP